MLLVYVLIARQEVPAAQFKYVALQAAALLKYVALQAAVVV